MHLLRQKWAELALHLGGAAVVLFAGGAGGSPVDARLLLLCVASVPIAYLAGVYVVTPRPSPIRLLAGAAAADGTILALAAALRGPRVALYLTGALAAYQIAGRLLVLAAERRRPRVIVVGSGELPDAVARAVTRRAGVCTRAPGARELEAVAVTASRRASTLVVRPDPDGDLGMREVVERAASSGARVLDCVTFLSMFEGAVPPSSLHEGWLDGAGGFALSRAGPAPAMKRAMDAIFAFAALIVAAPLLGLCALLVKGTSAGPVFFYQERIGRGGRPFRIVKFRTMVVHNPVSHSRYPAEQDPRITPVGRLLRRTHLDEIPQLVNILRGEMSLIGPRAEWSLLVADYRARIPWYDFRHAVRPGLTGWAQVRYRYGFSADDAAQKLRYDLYYVKHWSPFLDLVILARTVKTVLFGWAEDARF